MPKGFYLILYYPPGERAAAEAFLESFLAERASYVPGLAELNHAQIGAWHTHAGISPEPIFHGIPWTILEIHRPSGTLHADHRIPGRNDLR